MNAAARVSLSTLLEERRIERVPVDRTVVAALQKQAAAHLRTAGCGIKVDDPEGDHL